MMASALVMSVGPQVASASSTLLTTADQEKIANWLGEGALSLTTIYTKAAGDSSVDFHNATDGKGRTISIMQAYDTAGHTWIVGGYNPKSWHSDGSYNLSAGNNERTAFIFNLTSDEIYRQTPRGYAFDQVGAYQTYNGIDAGPVFGYGHDLYVSSDMSSGGYSNLYSYIDPVSGGFGQNIIDGSHYVRPNISYGAMQIFTITVVPEPATYGMLISGLLLVGAVALRKRDHSIL